MASVKRKAINGAAARANKRVASGAGTPASIQTSDDDYEDSDSGGSASDFKGEEKVRIARNKHTLDAYQKKKPMKRPDSAVSGLRDDLVGLSLKPDHELRPIWLDPANGTVILESFNQLAKQAQDFLVAIAEPQSRPQFLHEYKINPQSLLSASSVGLNAHEIIRNLDKFSKNTIPRFFKDWVTDITRSFGKIKLVLKHNQYFVESSDADALQKLLRDPIIGPLRLEGTQQTKSEKASTMNGLVIPGTKDASNSKAAELGQTQKPEANRDGNAEDADSDADEEFAGPSDTDFEALLRREDEDDDDDLQQVHSFQIADENIEKVKERCLQIDLPVTEEYDFRNDARNANLDIDLRPVARIRDYQEKSLSKMFGNGRAKSGIIVLPCGAGKTLVGITAACTVRKGIIVLCTNNMSVVQWKTEFLKWSNVNPKDVAVFTSDIKERFSGSTGIIVSTYSMVSKVTNRAYDTQKVIDFIRSREWGLMILDEVHVVPAKVFRAAAGYIKAHSKLGLTATLLREDDKISDLNYLIGPKLYEANWMELAAAGHIARVQCAEVWCPMTAEFYTEYLRASHAKKKLLYMMNPRKFQACQFLIDYHERRGDKIIVFSDNVYTLERYARKLNKAFIFGGTPQQERLRILENFQHNEQVNTMFLSKIGDTSIDLPEATCLIQVSSHYGSRRQEAQRLGRILRAKRRNDEGFNAFFYSLVSKDTTEMVYSSKRQAFLVDQGYAFKVITHLAGIERMKGLAFESALERRELLQDVMLQNEMSAAAEDIEGGDMWDTEARRHGRGGGGGGGKKGKQGPLVKRTAGTLQDLSGGQDMAYMEYNKSRNAQLKKDARGKKEFTNPFLRKIARESERRRKATE
ncbi:MAG: hypothetical protein Q9162_000364 [Coniocarpon cinnabarinum]